MNRRFLLLLAIGLVVLLALFSFSKPMVAAADDIIMQETFHWRDPWSGGEVSIRVRVIAVEGKYLWVYRVTNHSYDPEPGTTNGFSGFNVVFPQAIPELSGQKGPDGWILNCCGQVPPFGAEFDLPNREGFGIPIEGRALFGFYTDPRVPVEGMGSWAHSWWNNTQTPTFSGTLLVPGELIPPEDDVVMQETYHWMDPVSGGEFSIRVRVIAEGGKFLWVYRVTNYTFDPVPGRSNGFSGFNVVFPQAIPELSGQKGPDGWELNCCGSVPPFGAEFDIRNSDGFGIPVNGARAMFGFWTDPRYPVETTASWAHSWVEDSQLNTFSNTLLVPGGLVP